MDMYYFKPDGSYGLLDEGSVVTDTSMWTLADWASVEDSTDSERTFIVRGIVSKYATN